MSPPPTYSNWLLFCGDFCTRHPPKSPKQRPSFNRRCPRSSRSSVGLCALYVTLYSPTLALHQRIRPFTTNKALSGPPLHRTPFHPVSPWSGVVCVGGFRLHIPLHCCSLQNPKAAITLASALRDWSRFCLSLSQVQ